MLLFAIFDVIVYFSKNLNFNFGKIMNTSNLLRVAKSVISAAVGIQNNKNRQHDFENGSVGSYVIGGIIFTIIFVITIVSIVSMVL